MTHTLVLLRHAKAEPYGGLGDKQRALAPRGRNQASAFGDRLAAEAGPFDVAIVSGALRTRETYRLLAGQSDQYPAPVISEDLYEATARRLLTTLQQLPEEAGSVIVVGHEPVMSTLGYMLHDTQDDLAHQIMLGIPTSTAIVLDVPGTWAELDRSTAHVRAVLRPKE